MKKFLTCTFDFNSQILMFRSDYMESKAVTKVKGSETSSHDYFGFGFTLAVNPHIVVTISLAVKSNLDSTSESSFIRLNYGYLREKVCRVAIKWIVKFTLRGVRHFGLV
jgi:hypothetical protein